MYAEYLQFSGFRVAEARNGNEARRAGVRAEARPDPDGPVAAGHGRLGGDAPAEGGRRDQAHSRRRADRPRAGRRVGRREEGGLRLVRHQAVPARRSRRRGPPDAEYASNRVRLSEQRIDAWPKAEELPATQGTRRSAPAEGAPGGRRRAAAGGDAAQHAEPRQRRQRKAVQTPRAGRAGSAEDRRRRRTR